MNKFRPIAKINSSIVSHFVLPHLEERILDRVPERIVIFHFLLIKPVIDILQKHSLNVPVFVVVTDPYTAHPIWFVDKNQQFIVFSRQVKDSAISAGVPSDNITILPFPVDEKFSVPFSHENIESTKLTLGLHPQHKTIVLLGGADGIPDGDVLARHLSHVNPEANIVIVCGRSTSLFNRLTAWVEEKHVRNVKVFGYIDFIYDLINIADVVVTKCGASTLMEVLLSKKIPVVNSYLWEQEKGNVDFIRTKNIGIYEPHPRRLSLCVRSLLENTIFRAAVQRNIEEINLINGSETVARYIAHDLTNPSYWVEQVEL
jgi:processive 1,2-diacylglycerol beta-glucosyltransferase/1,2-diacylglycerol 3-beta-galactosyltransferase